MFPVCRGSVLGCPDVSRALLGHALRSRYRHFRLVRWLPTIRHCLFGAVMPAPSSTIAASADQGIFAGGAAIWNIPADIRNPHFCNKAARFLTKGRSGQPYAAWPIPTPGRARRIYDKHIQQVGISMRCGRVCLVPGPLGVPVATGVLVCLGFPRKGERPRCVRCGGRRRSAQDAPAGDAGLHGAIGRMAWTV